MTEPGEKIAFLGHRQRRRRYVVEDVLLAFHHACDARHPEIAWRLIVAAENAMNFEDIAPLTAKRAIAKKLVSAHERLWFLVHGPD